MFKMRCKPVPGNGEASKEGMCGGERSGDEAQQQRICMNMSNSGVS